VAANGVGEQSQAEQTLSGALGRLMLVVEAYPDLKANQNFLALQEELTSTENKIGFARQAYNDSVMQFNTKIQTVPANIVAGMFQFSAEQFFEVQEAAVREAPKVSFS
jgi:LemA protein